MLINATEHASKREVFGLFFLFSFLFFSFFFFCLQFCDRECSLRECSLPWLLSHIALCHLYIIRIVDLSGDFVHVPGFGHHLSFILGWLESLG